MTYGYDPRGLLASVTDAAGVGASYGYDAAGRRVSTALTNGMPPSVYTYDNADRLTSITHTYLDASNVQQQLVIGYTYDNAGNRLTMSDNRATPAGTTTYTYDSLDRLTSATDPASALTTYGYDAAGNRTSVTTGGSTVTSTFDALNRLLGDTSGASYTYDANGNQLTKTAAGVTTTYSYDTLDRMTGLSGGPHSAVYTYNGDGLRVSKAVDGGAAVYQTWAALGQPRVIRDGTTDYLWSGEVIAQVAMGGTAQYAQGDGLGSTRQITDNTGHVVGSQQYDAYGQPQQQTGTQAQPTPGWSIGFTGQQMDAESGLVYLRARYYNPDSGRLLSQDAIGAPGNYVYANNNPTRFIDPSGRFPTSQDVLDAGCGIDSGECAEALSSAQAAAVDRILAEARRQAASFQSQVLLIGVSRIKITIVAGHTALFVVDKDGNITIHEGGPSNGFAGCLALDCGKVATRSERITPDQIKARGFSLAILAIGLRSDTDFRGELTEILKGMNMKVDYNPFTGPNSNSVTYTALVSADMQVDQLPR